MHITFAGTPKFAKNVLKRLLDNGIAIDAVVTAEDRPQGRGQKKKPTPVKKIAKDENIAIFYNLNSIIEKTDLVLVAAYGKIISEEDLQVPKHGFLNVHPSLLPKYRGPSPIQEAILNGDKKTGTTIMVMDEEIDHGPVLIQKEVRLMGDEYYKDLEDKLSKMGGDLLVDIIPKWKSKKNKATPQNHDIAIYTSLLSKKDGLIDWSDSASKIERKIRAYNPWPGCYTGINNKLMKIFKAEVQKQTEDGPFGKPGKTYLGTNSKIAVQTGEDFLLIEELQIEGGRKTNSKEFLQGNDEIIGQVLS